MIKDKVFEKFFDKIITLLFENNIILYNKNINMWQRIYSEIYSKK